MNPAKSSTQRRDPAGSRDGIGPVQLASRLGWDRGEVERARTAGVIPGPDMDGRRWSTSVVERLAADAEALRARVPPSAVGAERAAQHIATANGRQVDRQDIETLAETGLLPVAGWFKGWPLYRLDAIADAAVALANDPDVAELVRRGQLLTTTEAVKRLGVRRRDFERMARWGWITPARVVTARPHGAAVDVALYRIGDLEDLAARADIDWPALQALRPGQRSPLLKRSTTQGDCR